VFDMLLTFTEFSEFKELMLAYKNGSQMACTTPARAHLPPRLPPATHCVLLSSVVGGNFADSSLDLSMSGANLDDSLQ
jgi:hypothetical protein